MFRMLEWGAELEMVQHKTSGEASLASRLPALLIDAHISRKALHFSSDASLDVTREQAFETQGLVARTLGPTVGWKVGRKSPSAEPNYAPLFERRLFKSGDHIGRDLFRTWEIEAELMFRLDRDLPPKEMPYSRDDLAQAAGAVFVVFEILDSRYAAWPDLPAPLLLADFLSHGAMVIGTQAQLPSPAVFDAVPVTLAVDGQVVIAHKDGNPVGDVLDLAAWLANELAANGAGLRKGDFVTTGSYTGMYHLAPGCQAVATFAGIGSVSIARDA
jgi:2-keto-4-pentenoate hydratase